MKKWIVILSLAFAVANTAAEEESDIRVEGPIKGVYAVTMIYRGYEFKTTVKGKPDSDKNMDYLLNWQEKLMEATDAALQHH
jgi:hypothetical protein